MPQWDYLGIRCSKNPHFGDHCRKIASKASKSLGLIRRCLKPCSKNVKERAYMSLVRPSLEYASAAWSTYDTDVKGLEQVQKSAARFVCCDYKLTTSTTGLVKGLGWDTLEDRRLLNQSTLFYKFHHNTVNWKLPTEISRSSHVRALRRHSNSYLQLQSNIQSFTYSFFPRSIRLWNSLSPDVVASTPLNSFKQSAMPAIRSAKMPRHFRRL